MGKYIGPKNKLARRFGVHLGLKSNSAKVAKRLSQPPGIQGLSKGRKNVSSYGKQLLEKQKAGKKRMKSIGKVQLPSEAFMSVLKMD